MQCAYLSRERVNQTASPKLFSTIDANQLISYPRVRGVISTGIVATLTKVELGELAKGNLTMNVRNILLMFSIILLVTACGSSPEKQKAKAEARHIEEETKTMQEYKSCVKKAKTDEAKLDACERLMKAVQ